LRKCDQLLGDCVPQTLCPGALPLDPTEGSVLRLPEARARRARHARQLAPHALNSNSAHVFKADIGLLNICMGF